MFPKRLNFSRDGTRERVKGAISKSVPRKRGDNGCPLGDRGTRGADPIRIKGSGVGIGIRYLSVQSVVKNDPAGRFQKYKS